MKLHLYEYHKDVQPIMISFCNLIVNYIFISIVFDVNNVDEFKPDQIQIMVLLIF